jgi:hyperosmotically inducible protein
MKKTLLMSTALVMACLTYLPAIAGDDADMDRSHPKAFVKDSAITTKIKAKLAAKHLTSLGRIKVDTDADGVVWLSGTARSQEDIDQAVAIAKSTEHVVTVKNELMVRKDD